MRQLHQFNGMIYYITSIWKYWI